MLSLYVVATRQIPFVTKIEPKLNKCGIVSVNAIHKQLTICIISGSMADILPFKLVII